MNLHIYAWEVGTALGLGVPTAALIIIGRVETGRMHRAARVLDRIGDRLAGTPRQ